MLRYHFGYTLARRIRCTLGYRLRYKLGNRIEYKTIPYFSAHCISDHRISKPNPNSNHNPNPDNSPDHDCSHLLVRDAVVRNAVGRKGGHRIRLLIG